MSDVCVCDVCEPVMCDVYDMCVMYMYVRVTCDV